MSSSPSRLPPEAEDKVFACLESADPRAALDRLCEEHPAEAAEYRAIFDRLEQMGLLTRLGSGVVGKSTESFINSRRLGPYRILEQLGHGGMGVVFLGVEEELGRKVAVKLIRPEQLYVPGNRERFKREVDALLELSHPGIVRVLGAGEHEQVPYYAMEFVEGLSVAEILRGLRDKQPSKIQASDLLVQLEQTNASGISSSGTRLTEELQKLAWPDLVLRIVGEAAEALQHAHERQIIHRDVKPSNLLLTRAGHVRLVDFGLARIEDGQELTRSTAELGSLPYMPPEFLGGSADRIDPRQDVYSLGVTLYELLTLHCPYLGKDQEETRRLIRDAHPPDPRKLNPKVSWDLSTVCLKAMDPDPQCRYQSCADLLLDLRNLAARRPILAQRPKPLLRLRRWGERNPRSAVAISVSALLLLIAGFVYGMLESSSRRKIEGLYEQARYVNYVGNIRAAGMYIDTNECADGKLRLLRCPEEYRQLEWNILDRRLDQSLRILSQGRQEIHDIALSSDGTLLASVDRGLRLEIQSLPSGELLVADDASPMTNRVCFLHGTHLLVMGGMDGIVRIYDADARKLVDEVSQAEPISKKVTALAHLHQQGLLAIAYENGRLQLWNLKEKRLTASQKVHRHSIQKVAINPKGDRLATVSVDQSAKVVSVPDLETQHTIKLSNWGMAAAFIEDGGALLTIDASSTISHFDLATSKQRTLKTGSMESTIYSALFAADGKSVYQGAISLFKSRLQQLTVRTRLLGHQGQIHTLALSQDGKRIYTGSMDGTVREWDTRFIDMLRPLAKSTRMIGAVAWVDDHRWVAGDSQGHLLRSDMKDQERVRRTKLDAESIFDIVHLKGDEFAVAQRHGKISFFSWKDDGAYQHIEVHSVNNGLQRWNGGILAHTTDGGASHIVRKDSKWTSTQIPLSPSAHSLAASTKHDRIYWGDKEGKLYCRDAKRTEGRAVPLTGVVVVALHHLEDPDHVAIVGKDHAIHLLDLETEEIVSTLRGHTRKPDTVRMPAGSNRVVSSGGYGNRLNVWDLRLVEKLLSIKVPFATFSMDLDSKGQKILLGMMMGYVVLCDGSPSGRELILTQVGTRSTPSKGSAQAPNVDMQHADVK